MASELSPADRKILHAASQVLDRTLDALSQLDLPIGWEADDLRAAESLVALSKLQRKVCDALAAEEPS